MELRFFFSKFERFKGIKDINSRDFKEISTKMAASKWDIMAAEYRKNALKD